MALIWTKEASQAAADLMNENSSLDFVLFTIPNPKKPEVVVESKGNGGRQAVFNLLGNEASQKKVLTGAFVVSAVDEKGSVTSVRRKLVHVTFAGSQVGIMTKGKLNGWSGPFRDPFPGCATYLQLMGGDLDDLQEGDLEATLMAAGGATKYDFSNQTLRGSLGLPEIPTLAPTPAPIVSSGKRFKKPTVAAPPAPTPAPEPAPAPAKLTKTQEALQKMKAHKQVMKRTAKPEKTSPERPVLQPVTVQEKEPEPPTPEPAPAPKLLPPGDANGREFLMLLSTQSGSNQQVSDCKTSKQILKSIGVEPIIVDGADPQSKKQRDNLFRLSGIRGNYPQFFVVQKRDLPQEEEEGEATFFGDYKTLNEKKQNGTLAVDIGLGDDSLGPLPEQEENTETATNNKKLVLLISSMCNAKVMAEQNHAKAVINGLGIHTTNQLEVLDGCDQTLRDRRNELWGVSGVRAQYPQLFTVDNDDTSKIQFVGDYENIMYLHDHGSLEQEIGLSTA